MGRLLVIVVINRLYRVYWIFRCISGFYISVSLKFLYIMYRLFRNVFYVFNILLCIIINFIFIRKREKVFYNKIILLWYDLKMNLLVY